MCKGRSTCSELGADANQWSKTSPLPPPEYFERAGVLFTSSVQELVQGNFTSAIELLGECQSDLVGTFFIEHGQQSAYYRVLNRKEIDRANRLSKVTNPTPRLRPKVEREVFVRDSFRCRYCGLRIVQKDVFQEYSRILGSNLFSVARKNSLRNGLTLGLRGVGDHVDPYAGGGETTLENLVTSCYSCNFGKAGYTLKQLGIEDPRLRNPINDSWRGLTEHLPALKKMPGALSV